MIFYEDKNITKALNSWIDLSDQASARKLDNYRSVFPYMFKQYSNKLYRGMILPDKPTKAFTINEYTSWSKDKNIALKFINDPKYRVSKKTGQGYLITKIIPASKIVLDIHSLVLFLGPDKMIELGVDDFAVDSALKEQEVLVMKTLTINPGDVQLIGK